MTGIDSLQNDPQNFGGGTHENREGQGLDPLVDFNYHPTTEQHRRLNLIVYLNEDWDDAWGGALEIHSDPRRPDQNEVASYSPSLNRAIIFETNEYSWHGFRRIRLPQTEQHRSRKSLSLYFYTDERPAESTVSPHTTFYVQRPVREFVRAGEIVTSTAFAELEKTAMKRDNMIDIYQRKEIEAAATLQAVVDRLAVFEPGGAGAGHRTRRTAPWDARIRTRWLDARRSYAPVALHRRCPRHRGVVFGRRMKDRVRSCWLSVRAASPRRCCRTRSSR